MDNQTFINYPGWYNYQESAVFFVLDENLQTDTILILPPSSGAYLKIEDMAVGPDSILYVSFLEKYLKTGVPFPYLEIRKVLYGFDKNYNIVSQWVGPDLDMQESWACLAVGSDTTIYINHKHDYRTYLMAMKPDHSVKWECLLDSTIGWNLYHIRRLVIAENGDILGTGIISSAEHELGESGFLFRISPQGELKWKRAIRVNKGFDLTVPEIYPYQTGLEDLAELPNGDLIAVGYVRKYVGNTLPDGPYNFDIWIVRTSSEGCLWEDCPYIQDVVTEDNYIPVVTPLNEWVVDYEHPVPGWPAEKIRRYTFSADSAFIDGKYYHELIYSINMSGGPWASSGSFLREENGKVYTKADNLPERLIYDFHFGIGDSLTGGNNVNQATRYVTQVGSTQLLDGVPRKKITLDSQCGETEWTEGIGETYALFYSESVCSLWDGIPLYIRCFSTNGQLLYKRPDISGCYTTSVGDVGLTTVHVFPNPGSDILHIEAENEESITTVVLYNSIGVLALTTSDLLPQSNGVDISTLPPGFYAGLVCFGDHTVKAFKFVVER
ncbi:MAG: T9SS type A sorting domain-containing protein [Saprospiraceae bacterium]